jgi:hypothetical protein
MKGKEVMGRGSCKKIQSYVYGGIDSRGRSGLKFNGYVVDC